jgi:hypothetical protein
MTSLPDELFGVRYDGAPGVHVIGSRNGTAVHLCSASHNADGTQRNLGEIFVERDQAVDCPHCQRLLSG